jgi:hypothetical protein
MQVKLSQHIKIKFHPQFFFFREILCVRDFVAESHELIVHRTRQSTHFIGNCI